jgi:hypothetical protein
MIRLFVIFGLSLLVCNPGQTQSTKDEIHLRATVRDVVPLSDFSGEITPVDFDPRFALTVRIESVDPAVGNFPAGTVVDLPSTARHWYLETMPPKERRTTFPYNVRLSMAKQGFWLEG